MIEDIANKIAEKMDLKEWNYNTIISKFGRVGEPTHKFIIRINTSKDKREFFVKVCKDPNISKYLLNEAKNLEYLNKLDIKGIPSLILTGSHYGKKFMVESFIPGKKVSSYLDIIELARQWLVNLYSKTQKGFVSCDVLIDKASEYTDYLSNWFDLGDAINLMEKYKPDKPLPLVFTHGDFWSDNIIVTREGIGVIDFSNSEDNQPPLDIFTFINYLSLENPKIFASTKRLRNLTIDFLPDGVDPYFMLIYNSIRRAAQITSWAEELYNNLLIIDSRQISKFALYQIWLLKNLSLNLRTK